MGKPIILVTNDDGITAPGILALARSLKQIGQVIVVAPSTERSAVGHAITLSDPLRVRSHELEEGIQGYAVNGTPADCVKIAYWVLMDARPELVVSGINLGPNTGINTIYSGTVSAATEGAILGVPSFAVSLGTFVNPDFSYAASFSARFAEKLLSKGLPEGVCLNVNVPACPENEIEGVKITRQGMALYQEEFDQRTDPHGGTYYWLTGQKIDKETSLDVDDGAVAANYVSITPVHYDLTQHEIRNSLRSWDIDK